MGWLNPLDKERRSPLNHPKIVDARTFKKMGLSENDVFKYKITILYGKIITKRLTLGFCGTLCLRHVGIISPHCLHPNSFIMFLLGSLCLPGWSIYAGTFKECDTISQLHFDQIYYININNTPNPNRHNIKNCETTRKLHSPWFRRPTLRSRQSLSHPAGPARPCWKTHLLSHLHLGEAPWKSMKVKWDDHPSISVHIKLR